MLLLALGFFLTLLQCSNAQTKTSITPADCNTVERDAGVALDLVNRHRRDGYVFGLFRVADAHELHIVSALNSFIQHQKLICPVCCQVSDVMLKTYIWRVSLICYYLTLIRSIYPARSVFCYYLYFGDSWITGRKKKMQRKPKEMKMSFCKTGEGLDRESISVISYFLPISIFVS
uniref:Uncharacterized protein n=1 Tax=Strix occidentalis caurina TaxID=311401 RepID=A0A8D0EKG8_STROC